MKTTKTGLGFDLVVSILLLLAFTGLAEAQQSTGALYGTIRDTNGGNLPGVTLTLTGLGALKLQTTDDLGEFRFLGLDPASWSLEAKLDGFSPLDYPNIDIDASRNTTLQLQLSATIQDVISVTAESPLLDERKLSAGTTVTQLELDKIPTGRNSWALLTQVPGVLLSRVDVGDAYSADQGQMRGQGTSGTENDFVLDGVQIRSVVFGGGGNSPVFLDLDQLEELQFVTGGNDVTKSSAGVATSAVTKRGSNEFRGSARFLLTDRDGYFGVLEEAEPGFDPNELGPGQEDFVGDSIVQTQDYGFEGGGPAWRDRVWLWGTWSNKDLLNIRGGGEPERITMENSAIKVNAQFSTANSFVGSYSSNQKINLATNAGPGVDASAVVDLDGQTGVTILEDSHVFGSSFFVSGSFSRVYAAGLFVPRGGSGPDQPPTPEPGGEANVDANGTQTNNYTLVIRPRSDEWKLDASYFASTGTLSHEIKFGGRMRSAETTDLTSYPGRNLLHYDGGYAGVQNPGLLAVFGLPPERYADAHVVYAYRSAPATVINDYRSIWVQDTLTWSRWTVNVGLRYDRQDGENEPVTVEANPGFPEVMPAIEFPGNDGGGLDWSSISPRLGLTYALGEERRTLLRGSLSQFPEAMNYFNLARVNPVAGQFAAMLFLDEPGGFSAFYDDGEPFAVVGGFGFDPRDPTALSTPNVNDPNRDPATTTELIVGVEHAFLPQFVLGANLTWRRQDGVEDLQPLFEDLVSGEIRTASADEYVFDGTVSGFLPDGSPYAIDTFAASPTLEFTGGELATNGDREVDSFATSLTITKRLSNQWMLRGFVNFFFQEEWKVPASFFANNDPNKFLSGENRDRAPFVELTDRSTSALSSAWQWNVNGMYQVAPERAWGFNVAANLTGRQGYPIPYFESVPGTDSIRRRIGVADSITDFRYDEIFTADVRLEKEFNATGNTSLTFSIDGFNIFNEGTVLSRENNLRSSFSEWALRTIHPRVWRLGVRINWR
jgi:hypothetical protein